MEAVVDGVGDELVEVLGNSADVFGNGPLVVVEDQDKAFSGCGNVVEGLHGDSAGEGGIA